MSWGHVDEVRCPSLGSCHAYRGDRISHRKRDRSRWAICSRDRVSAIGRSVAARACPMAVVRSWLHSKMSGSHRVWLQLTACPYVDVNIPAVSACVRAQGPAAGTSYDSPRPVHSSVPGSVCLSATRYHMGLGPQNRVAAYPTGTLWDLRPPEQAVWNLVVHGSLDRSSQSVEMGHTHVILPCRLVSTHGSCSKR